MIGDKIEEKLREYLKIHRKLPNRLILGIESYKNFIKQDEFRNLPVVINAAGCDPHEIRFTTLIPLKRESDENI